MPIYGDTVGSSQRAADWKQDDPARVDNIKDKPNLTQTPEGIKSGSDLLMDSHKVTGLADPKQDTDACNLKVAKEKAKEAADKAVKEAVKTSQVTLTVEGWTEAQEQVADVTGATADTAKSLVQYSTDPSTRAAYMESDVYMSAQADGRVTFKWGESKPGVPLKVNIAVRALT